MRECVRSSGAHRPRPPLLTFSVQTKQDREGVRQQAACAELVASRRGGGRRSREPAEKVQSLQPHSWVTHLQKGNARGLKSDFRRTALQLQGGLEKGGGGGGGGIGADPQLSTYMFRRHADLKDALASPEPGSAEPWRETKKITVPSYYLVGFQKGGGQSLDSLFMGFHGR